eukprot:gene11634-biopygen5325
MTTGVTGVTTGVPTGGTGVTIGVATGVTDVTTGVTTGLTTSHTRPDRYAHVTDRCRFATA